MMRIHPQARTTPAGRAEIARSAEPTSVIAKRYGISDETVRKWRKRGEQACQDRSSRPRRLLWRVTEEERAIICTVRRSTGFPHRLLNHRRGGILSNRCTAKRAPTDEEFNLVSRRGKHSPNVRRRHPSFFEIQSIAPSRAIVPVASGTTRAGRNETVTTMKLIRK